jgi:hypothetical protein
MLLTYGGIGKRGSGRVDNNFMIPERDISPIKGKINNTALNNGPPNDNQTGKDKYKNYLEGAKDSSRTKKKHSIDISEDSDGDLEIE